MFKGNIEDEHALVCREAKLRDDTVNKLTVIENTLVEENRRKAAKEKEIQEKVEAQMNEAKLYGDAGNDSLKKHIDVSYWRWWCQL